MDSMFNDGKDRLVKNSSNKPNESQEEIDVTVDVVGDDDTSACNLSPSSINKRKLINDQSSVQQEITLQQNELGKRFRPTH